MAILAAASAGRKPRQRLLLALLTAAGAALLLAMARALPAQLAVRPRRCETKALLPLKHRELFGQLLEEEGFTVGAELGVQRGWFANVTLSTWKSCRKYYLVDAWAHQENYVEGANVNDDQQQANFELTQQRMERFSDKAVFMRMFTSQAAHLVLDESLDWVYIDARHDYCGCMEDLVAWWPKLKPNGIFSGHDFIDAAGVRRVHPQEDWAVCQNGSRHEGAVEGAVRDFARAHGLTVAVTYLEAGNPWKTWMIRKPCA